MNDRLAEFELHRRRLLVIGAATAFGIGSTTTAVADEHDGEFDDLLESNGLFPSAMSTDQQPGEVETVATGGALFGLREDGSELEYAPLVSAIEDANQAHIHLGTVGAEGPIAAWLYPDPGAEEPELRAGRFDGILATGTITDEHLTADVEGQTLDDLRREFDEGNTSVNVHTEQHPAGEIRGQIEVVADVVSALVDDESAPDFVDAVDDQGRLEYGETTTVSTGVEVTVHGVDLTAVAGDEEPIEWDAFAWVEVEAFNRSDDPQNLPHGSHFDIIFADQQVGWEIRAAADQEVDRERFDGEEVQGSVCREGYILFEVDEEIDESSIDVLRDDFLADVNVRWSVE